MKLVAFRIKNFRSIQDTDWQQLAHDNITCLIGQNESGKTSILEALKAFNDGFLIEDMLRSDLTLPEVSCRLEYETDELEALLDMKRLHPDIEKLFSKSERISIKRKWNEDLSSTLEMGEELNKIFAAEEDQRKQREIKAAKMLEGIKKEYVKASRSLNQVVEELKGIDEQVEAQRQRINDMKKSGRSIFSKDSRRKNKLAMEEEQKVLDDLIKDRRDKSKRLDEHQKEVNSLAEKQRIIDRIKETEELIHQRKNDLVVARENFKRIAQVVGFFPSEKEQRAAEAKEEQLRMEMDQIKESLEDHKRTYDILLMASEGVHEGKEMEKAIAEAKRTYENLSTYMSSEELARQLFKLVPQFEMFEDFSSLLPNRIDLEDIVTGNTAAEGYKAAKNFLTITELDYSFFQQPSNRILKQKIENLNGELTLNFQDFWRQNVGKNNKIKINFELAHYDHTQPDKSGKPYIEFWIKDESERLYPKQRSRGVRWFLSFFLELKATAKDQSMHNKILLIDEPGVSLHARAQEDVLKVFDDIKEQIQIIYSTHSPHLIDVNKLYRVLAVQRAVEDDMNSESLVYNTRSLRSATADTLSPVYAMMGARLSQQEIIKAYNNVVVKDLATFYFLRGIMELSGYNQKECYFIPASGTSSIPMIVNILIGWGLEYIVLTFANESETFVHKKLRKELFENNVDLASKQLLHMREFMDVEDMFSTIDFKKHIIHVREGITVSNSEYLKDNNHSRAVLASNFLQEIKQKKIQFKDFDEETRDNLNTFINQLTVLLK